MNETDLITCESQAGPRRTMAEAHLRGGGEGPEGLRPRRPHGGGGGRRDEPAPDRTLGVRRSRAGTPLIQADQRLGIDLPLRVLVWLDAQSRTQVSYVDPVALLRRRLGPDGALEARARDMASRLAALVAEVTGPVTADERLDDAVEGTFPASDPPELNCSG